MLNMSRIHTHDSTSEKYSQSAFCLLLLARTTVIPSVFVSVCVPVFAALPCWYFSLPPSLPFCEYTERCSYLYLCTHTFVLTGPSCERDDEDVSLAFSFLFCTGILLLFIIIVHQITYTTRHTHTNILSRDLLYEMQFLSLLLHAVCNLIINW